MYFWLRGIFLPMVVNAPAEDPKPDEDEASNGALLHQPVSINALYIMHLPL
jgi:hypothetical protein